MATSINRLSSTVNNDDVKQAVKNEVTKGLEKLEMAFMIGMTQMTSLFPKPNPSHQQQQQPHQQQPQQQQPQQQQPQQRQQQTTTLKRQKTTTTATKTTTTTITTTAKTTATSTTVLLKHDSFV